MMDTAVIAILVCTALLIALIGWLYLRQHESHRITHHKLTHLHRDVTEGHASLHQRFDTSQHEISYLHHKADRIRKGIALLFKGDMIGFAEWWRER